MKPPVSLKINLAPGDYRHAKHILPHQLKILAGQVDEIILTVDTKPSKGRFAEGWNEYKELLNTFLQDEIKKEWFTLKYGKRLESKFERPLIAFVSWKMHLIFLQYFFISFSLSQLSAIFFSDTPIFSIKNLCRLVLSVFASKKKTCNRRESIFGREQHNVELIIWP